jgi:hypothetical protein
MNKTTYCFKIKSPETDLLISIGFQAAKEIFPTKNDALKYREAYPEFFELKPFLRNCQVILIKETTTQTILEEF